MTEKSHTYAENIVDEKIEKIVTYPPTTFDEIDKKNLMQWFHITITTTSVGFTKVGIVVTLLIIINL